MANVVEVDFTIPTKDALTTDQYIARIARSFDAIVTNLFPNLVMNRLIPPDESGVLVNINDATIPDFIKNVILNTNADSMFTYSSVKRLGGLWWANVGTEQFGFAVTIGGGGYIQIVTIIGTIRGSYAQNWNVGIQFQTGSDANKVIKFLTYTSLKSMFWIGRALTATYTGGITVSSICSIFSVTSIADVADTGVAIVNACGAPSRYTASNGVVNAGVGPNHWNKMFNSVVNENISAFSENKIVDYTGTFTINLWNSKIPLHKLFVGNSITGLRGYLDEDLLILPQNFSNPTTNAEPFYEFITIGGVNYLMLNISANAFLSMFMSGAGTYKYLVVKV